MGTRSIIKFIEKYNEKEKPIVAVYQQYDGYLEYVGKQLCDFLSSKTIINGISLNQYTNKYANGIHCLAAQFIRDYKVEVGGLYIYPVDCENQDYNYDVIYDGNKITVRINMFDKEPFFEGDLDEFKKLIYSSLSV